MTLSLRKDEREELDKILKHRPDLTRHELVKWALRRYLFPNEKVVPLNGKVARAPPEGHFDIPHEVEKRLTIKRD